MKYYVIYRNSVPKVQFKLPKGGLATTGFDAGLGGLDPAALSAYTRYSYSCPSITESSVYSSR